jgi:hypothetical protein
MPVIKVASRKTKRVRNVREVGIKSIQLGCNVYDSQNTRRKSQNDPERPIAQNNMVLKMMLVSIANIAS